MSLRVPATAEGLAAAARTADLPLDADGLAEMVPVMTGIYAMLDALEPASLGDEAPATAFDAAWGK